MTPGADTPVGRERPAILGRRTLARPKKTATIPSGVRHPQEFPASPGPENRRRDRVGRPSRRPGGLIFALCALVAGGAVVRWLASLAHSVPYYVADEYIYSALARGIAEHGRPVVRGSTAAFPALLEPLQTSPFYALAGIETAFRLTQALHAFEMSLAAVPVFLLARRLGLTGGVSLACAAVAITSPALFWGSFTLADPVGYTLALVAVYTAVRALSEPRLSTQVAFVAAAGLATFARTQYVVLFAVLPAAALVVERGSVRRVVRRQWLTIGTTAAAFLGLVGAAAAGALGPYSAWIGVATSADVVAKSLALDGLTVALAAGLVVVPGAIVGLDLLLSRPRNRVEQAFAAVALFLGFALAGLASLGAFARVQERYLIALTPLAALLFAVWVERGMPRRRIAAAIAAALGAGYAAVELVSWEPAHSSTLHALRELDELTGTAAASRVAPVGLLVVAAVLLWNRRQSLAWGLGVTLVVTSFLSVGAYAFDRKHSEGVRETRLPAQKDWVDAMAVGDVALLHAPRAERAAPFQQLFWNESVGRVLQLTGAGELDFFAASRSQIDANGRLLGDGKPVTSAILAPLQGASFTFADGRLLRRTHDFELVRPSRGAVSVATAVFGRYRDGWLGQRSSVHAWPQATAPAASALQFVLSLPTAIPASVRVRLSAEGFQRVIVLEPGGRVAVRVPLESRSPLRLMVDAEPAIEIGGRVVTVRISRPRLV